MNIFERAIKLFKKINSENLWNENLVHFIHGTEVLAKPLEKDEEENLLQELELGKPETRQKLIEHNLRLVVYIAKKFENTGLDIEDLISVGSIGLIKAVNSFKYDKNIKLATYSSRCIENEILMYLRKMNKNRNDASLDEQINTESDGSEIRLADVLCSTRDIIEEELDTGVEKNLLWLAVDKLSIREQEIMQLRFGLNGGEERTQKEVAEMLSISQSYISRLEKKILARLKREFKKIDA
ncbi:MAG: sigma-70 family RNA polymerase sigma factor [Christensenellaceae bacterium]|jgi:RNA polymerase sporulation-specific sigma factor|nr:sigma-70 family RNA polymerase sigma factor [Christensenellaceae bacterium]